MGSLLPLLALLMGMLFRSPGVHLFRFFARFCLVTNGLYIGASLWMGSAARLDLATPKAGSAGWPHSCLSASWPCSLARKS